MPELPEIKRFSYIINSNGRGKSFKAPALALPVPFASGFRVHAIARGKELRLTMWPETNPSHKMWLLVTHGLVGRWRWSTKGNDNKGLQLSFSATDGSGELQFVDVQWLGKWTLMTEERWGKDRGADPVDEFALFKQNILDNRSKSVFSQPIGALMLDQKYFNGVGNYLRAEILCRAGVSPLQTAFAVFQNEVTRDKILQLCRLIPMEVLERGLNKYGTPSEVEEFEAWMRCYGKAKSSKDSSGRMIWFFEDQPKHEEPLPQVSEEAYQRMFPKGDEQPTASASAPATSFSFASAPPAASAISFSAPLVVKVGSATMQPTPSAPAKSSAVAAPSTGSIADSLYEQSWRSRLAGEFTQPYWTSLMRFLAAEKARGAQVFPPENQVFNALNLCPFENVRVVILGQDPYHDDGQAHGLSFSVPPGVPPPPSLKNIYKELQSDIGGRSPWASHGTLTAWAQRGVLLLNACLTVEAHKANSHAGKGWEEFTDAVIRLVSSQRTGVVFILWGGFAQKKGKAIDRSKHCILEGAHPSPLSVTKFLGCKHFSKANEYLTQHGHMPIDWTLPASATEQVKMASTAAPSFSLPPDKSAAAAPQQQSSMPMWKCMCCETDNSPLSKACSSCLVPRSGTPSPFAIKQAATQFGDKPALPIATAFRPAPVPKGGFTTTASVVAPPTATSTAMPSATDELVPAAEAVSRMGRMLLLLSTLHKSGHLSLEQKNHLKDLAIARDKLVFSALEAFAADEDRDLLEVADTFRRISKLRQR